MDDFNNFFDDQRNSQPEHTPVYHTPSPKNNKLGPVGILCVVLAVVMSVVVLVNVIVLASLKQTIAEEYAASISADMKEQYINAVNEALKDSDIVDDVTNAATQKALERLSYAVGQIADKYCSASVARLYMYTDTKTYVASGFLITDTDETGTTERYLLTNAHCLRYVTTTRVGYGFNSRYTYSWTSYKKIVAFFDGEETEYSTTVVAYGGYYDSEYKMQAENSQADIGLLKITGSQPSNEEHPSLTLETSDAERGDPVALIGNPEGIGETNSITSGSVSQPSIVDASLGAGTFVMTDAAVNGGNSGGPMVNIRGNVVGIVESKLADDTIDNMGFALSVSTIREFIQWASIASNNELNQNLNLAI